jgi:hypothetical protein
MTTIDAALQQLSGCGPEFGGFLSNHGPMAADALIALGRADAVEGWVAGYRKRLEPRPPNVARIVARDWRDALGHLEWASDWEDFIANEIAETGWRAALQAWVARLAPGAIAAAGHGLIRTAHSVRSLSQGETPLRLAELAAGLGYWAATYQELPGALAAPGKLLPADALDRVPLLDPTLPRREPAITGAVTSLHQDPAFRPVINLVDSSGDATAFAVSVARTFARAYLDDASHAVIPMIHAVTAPAAVALLAPHLDAETRAAALRYAWQASAGIYAVYHRPRTAQALRDASPADPGDLADRAVASGDEHAIKFTEACLRVHRLAPDQVFLVAAADACGRLRAR